MADRNTSISRNVSAYIDSQNLGKQQKGHKKGKSTSEEYTIVVESADKPKGACQGIIHVTIIGDNKTGDEHELAVDEFPKQFTRGHKNNFRIKDQKFKNIKGIYACGDMMVGNTGWNIDKIYVTRSKTGAETVIPVFTTIRSNRDYKFMVDDQALYQWLSEIGAKKSDQQYIRDSDLEEMKSQYELTEERLPGGPPLLKGFPPQEHFSFSYMFDIGGKLELLKGDASLKELLMGEFHMISDIEKVYDQLTFPQPSNLNRWRDDILFGMQRLMGNNCEVICLCTQIPGKLAVDTKTLEEFLEHKTVERALNEKRLFIVDYQVLEGLPTKEGFIMSAPVALFYQRDDGILVPVAIQLFQNPGENNPVFYPSDPENTWILAKMWFNVADANYHESVPHLGFTHLKMEGVVACTHRQIHKTHHIYKLLMPHFLYLIAINRLGLPILIGDKGFVDKVLTLGNNGMKALIVRKNKTWRMDVEGTLPNELKARGVDDPDLLPHYYYRDDAIELYDAIFSYVQNYLSLYYMSDAAVVKDPELQNWRKEIVGPVDDQGLGMLGVYGENDKFTTREQVCLTLTSIIYTCSAQHAAANFRQYEEYAYPPNCPARLRGQPPTNKTSVDEMALLKTLPDKITTYNTMVIANTLSTRGMKKLGDFEVNYITDKKALKVVDEFRLNLERIAQGNKRKNNTRLERYICLSPSLVPNSISV